MNDNKKTILFVDDEKSLREAAEFALSYEGFEVITASNGEDGVRLALEKKPDLIFLDLVMPKMGGVEALKELRADEWGKNAEIIIVTVSDDMSMMAECIEYGANEYVLKNDISLRDVVKKAKMRLGGG